jgi:hypothetical protein
MAVTNATYGSRTEFTSDSNLNSLANGTAKPLGVVDSTATNAVGYKVEIEAALASTGVSATGTITVYLIEAATNTTTTFTDGINPAGTSAVTVVNARPIRVLNANMASTTVYDTFDLPVVNAPKYWSLVISNGSGAAFASSGNGVWYTPVTYTTA